MNIYNICSFAFLTTLLAIQYGLTQPLARAILSVLWLLMLLALLFGSRLGAL
jgi:hypothetical protein